MGTKNKWRERREFILGKCQVYTNLDELIHEARSTGTSLAVFKPTEVLDLKIKDGEREWSPHRVEEMRAWVSQNDLFDDNEWRKNFELVDRIPWKWSYQLLDDSGVSSTMQILDWEIGALYRNCLRDSGGDEDKACEKVRQKYFDAFLETDLHLFLGTTKRFHLVGPNPWMIVGVFPIPFEHQASLF